MESPSKCGILSVGPLINESIWFEFYREFLIICLIMHFFQQRTCRYHYYSRTLWCLLDEEILCFKWSENNWGKIWLDFPTSVLQTTGIHKKSSSNKFNTTRIEHWPIALNFATLVLWSTPSRTLKIWKKKVVCQMKSYIKMSE